jgi:hypothetical protein
MAERKDVVLELDPVRRVSASRKTAIHPNCIAIGSNRALYHVMARGDGRENIIGGDKDRRMFIETFVAFQYPVLKPVSLPDY